MAPGAGEGRKRTLPRGSQGTQPCPQLDFCLVKPILASDMQNCQTINCIIAGATELWKCATGQPTPRRMSNAWGRPGRLALAQLSHLGSSPSTSSPFPTISLLPSPIHAAGPLGLESTRLGPCHACSQPTRPLPSPTPPPTCPSITVWLNGHLLPEALLDSTPILPTGSHLRKGPW